jgi:hypothetical protein
MAAPLVRYLQKLDNPPFYNAGKELITVEYDRGWIEYLSDTSDVYYTHGLTYQQYQMFLPVVPHYLSAAYHLREHSKIGLIKKLTKERLEYPFSMPLFADLRIGYVFSCGSSRFTALVLCGIEPEEIPVVFQADKNQKDSRVGNAQLMSSTDQIDQVANLHDKQFILTFTKTLLPAVEGSVLRNSIYESPNVLEVFDEDGKCAFDFWDKFTTNDRININIKCSNSTKSLIKFNEDIWNVTFSELENHSFAFGEILAKFGLKEPGQLNLFVYDITDEFHLEYLIPWTHPNNVWYHTLNKKVHLVDTTRGPNSATWPIVAMGNFVK